MLVHIKIYGDGNPLSNIVVDRSEIDNQITPGNHILHETQWPKSLTLIKLPEWSLLNSHQ